MQRERTGQTAVIFLSVRTGEDEAGYDAAAAAMDALAAEQRGYRGMASVRGGDGIGITVSYWADDASARRWRDHPEHVRIRNAGRGIWYTRYEISVATVTRGYQWSRP
ncbi:antibiotic biosynthesis monooxygenase [Sphingomonas koreensis]|nr:antibiotic biosynthesis monooxygenase [Sphingomonas koreensis]